MSINISKIKIVDKYTGVNNAQLNTLNIIPIFKDFPTEIKLIISSYKFKISNNSIINFKKKLKKNKYNINTIFRIINMFINTKAKLNYLIVNFNVTISYDDIIIHNFKVKNNTLKLNYITQSIPTLISVEDYDNEENYEYLHYINGIDNGIDDINFNY